MPATLKSHINKVIDELSPSQQREVIDFASFISQRERSNSNILSRKKRSKQQPDTSEHSKIRYDLWAGCLSHIDKSAVELQHEANRSWSDHSKND